MVAGNGYLYAPWPRPSKLPGDARLLELIDEYERRAYAIGVPGGERERRAFAAYRGFAICARGWQRELSRARPRPVEATNARAPGPVARPFRQALDALSRANP